MADVAQRAGVSQMTVSNAYKQPSKVAATTRRRIIDVAEALGYVPNVIAGNLASGRSRVIAAIVPSLSNSYFHATLQGMMDELRLHSYQLMLADSGFNPEDEERAVEAFLGRRPDGIILTGTRHTKQTAALLRGSGIPVVEAWETKGPFIDMGIGYSHYRASKELTRRLIDKGHREIGYIDHPLSLAKRHRQRLKGIKDTLETADLRSDLLVGLPEVAGFGGGRIGLELILARSKHVSAVIAATDVYAVGAMFECTQRGLEVPKDIALCGFGDFEVGREARPALTTVDTHSYEIGRGAAQMLIERVSGNTVTEKVRDVGFEILERKST